MICRHCGLLVEPCTCRPGGCPHNQYHHATTKLHVCIGVEHRRLSAVFAEPDPET